jgi:hypothetical protein
LWPILIPCPSNSNLPYYLLLDAFPQISTLPVPVLRDDEKGT